MTNGNNVNITQRNANKILHSIDTNEPVLKQPQSSSISTVPQQDCYIQHVSHHTIKISSVHSSDECSAVNSAINKINQHCNTATTNKKMYVPNCLISYTH